MQLCHRPLHFLISSMSAFYALNVHFSLPISAFAVSMFTFTITDVFLIQLQIQLSYKGNILHLPLSPYIIYEYGRCKLFIYFPIPLFICSNTNNYSFITQHFHSFIYCFFTNAKLFCHRYIGHARINFQ